MTPTARFAGVRRRRLRRLAAAVLVVVGGLMLWGSVAAPSGLILMTLGLVVEAVGLTLEHRKR